MHKKNKDKLRIAMLGHKRIPSREGGVEIVVEELCTRMVNKGHKVTCYNRGGHHVSGKEFDSAKIKNYKGINLKTVPTINCKGLAAMSASVFAGIKASMGRYDIVHFHAEGPCAMLWLPKLFGKRCIATIHGLDHQRAKWGKLASTYIMMGEKCAVKHADEIIVLSRGVQDYFRDTYGRETKFIPNGVNRPIVREPQIIKEKFGLDKDDYILFLGRLVPEKGLKYLVEAFKSTLEEAKYADIIIHVVDSVHPDMDRQIAAVYETLDELQVGDKPVITLFNKTDLAGNAETIKDMRAKCSMRVSAKTGEGIDEFLDELGKILRENRIHINRCFKYQDAGRIQLIREFGTLISEEYTQDGIEVEAYVPKEIYDKL